MPALLSQSWKLSSSLALVLSVLALFVAFSMSTTPCASAASGSCSVGDLETFTSGITVNEDGNDADTRIEGDTEVNLIYADAGNNRVGIGTASPASELDVTGDVTISSQMAMGTASINSAVQAYLAETKTTTANSIGVLLETGAQDTSGAHAGFLSGITSTPRITAGNNQNWTGTVGIRGIDTGVETLTSSTLAITGGAGVFVRTPIEAGSTFDNTYSLYAQSATVGTNNWFVFNAGAMDSQFGTGDILFGSDGVVDIGKTATRAANLWSDLINGADYGFDNGWRMLESDTYLGYGPGIAIDFGVHFIEGEALAVKHVDNGRTKEVEVGTDPEGHPIFETRTDLDRERVTNVALTPIFAVTNDFIEFHGVRITLEDWTALAALAAAN